jgi:hypothetical protein
MRARALQYVIAALVAVSGVTAAAQVTWQPTPPPLVTAENETWYRAGDAIEWSGDLYYPAGPPVFFNRYQMVRAGSYRGIPLYTDTTQTPYSFVLVPIGGDRLQPYERPRGGALAGTVGTNAPSFPTEVGGEGDNLAAQIDRQAPGAAVMARPYDVGSAPQPAAGTANAAQPVGTTGRVTSASSTSSRSLALPGRIDSVVPPRGVNGIWVNYNGQRWFESGMARPFDDRTFTAVGTYNGFTVYERNGQPSTIYIESTPGRLAPYKRR